MNLISIDRSTSLLTSQASLMSEYLDRCLQGKKDFQLRHLIAFVEGLDDYMDEIKQQIGDEYHHGE